MTQQRPPATWKLSRLDQIADIRFSGVDKRSVDGEAKVRLCNYMDVLRNARIREQIHFMEATATAREIENFSIRRGDILLTKDSETAEDIAFVARVDEELSGIVLGYHLALIRPDQAKVDPGFLFWQLRHPRLRRHFIRRAVGVVRSALSLEAVRAAEVWLAPHSEQKALADTLDTLENELDLLRALTDVKEQQKVALVDKLMSGRPRK